MRRKSIRFFLTIFLILSICSGSPISLLAITLHDVTDGGPPIITEGGILFRYKDEEKNPQYVMVSGDFNNWKKPLLMVKNIHNVYVYLYNEKDERSVVLKEGKYRYRYLVDGIWMKDEKNYKYVYDSYGTELSYFEVKKPIIITAYNPVHVSNNKYVFYYRDETAKKVYIVGDFNNQNPYSHPLKKNKSGIWEIELHLPPGSYAYRFIVDGIYSRDPLGTKIVHDRFDNVYTSVGLPLK